MPVDFSKPMETAKGKPVKLLFNDERATFYVIEYGDAVICVNREDDSIYSNDIPILQIRNRIPKPREWWINIYKGDEKYIHNTASAAEIGKSPEILETVHVHEVIEQ